MKREAKGEEEEGVTKAMDSPKGLAQSSSESSSQHELGSPVMPGTMAFLCFSIWIESLDCFLLAIVEPSSPFGHKSGYRSHLYAAKASDLMKSNNLDVRVILFFCKSLVYTAVCFLESWLCFLAEFSYTDIVECCKQCS